MKKILLLSLTSAFMSFAIHKDDHSPVTYKIFASATGNEVKLNQIISEVKNYDVVFFGEEHNDSIAHILQMELMRGIYNTYGDKTVLSMEMFESDCQVVLDEYLKGYIREKNFLKEARTWSNYRNYKPMIEFAKEKKLNVVAANAPARYTNMASRMGRNSLLELSANAKTFLPPLPYDTATGAYYEKFTGLMSDGRNAGIPAKDTNSKIATPPPANSMMPKYIVHAQSLWDATMAYSISKVFKTNNKAKVLQLNGRFHSDEGFGAVAQLKKYNPKLRIMIISCISGGKEFPDNINYNENKKLGDYVIYSDPMVPKTYKD
jgi:uncharacterized iron-regulated protein